MPGRLRAVADPSEVVSAGHGTKGKDRIASYNAANEVTNWNGARLTYDNDNSMSHSMHRS